MPASASSLRVPSSSSGSSYHQVAEDRVTERAISLSRPFEKAPGVVEASSVVWAGASPGSLSARCVALTVSVV